MIVDRGWFLGFAFRVIALVAFILTALLLALTVVWRWPVNAAVMCGVGLICYFVGRVDERDASTRPATVIDSVPVRARGRR